MIAKGQDDLIRFEGNGPASWASVLAFEKNLELGLISNDGAFVYATDPTVGDKWQQTAKLAGYPSFLWETFQMIPLSVESTVGQPSRQPNSRLGK
jgi:hypothetical protein